MRKSVRCVSGLSLVLAACATLIIAACSDASTAPTVRRASPAPGAIQRDEPPDSTCFGGWIDMGGRWVCV